MKIDLKSLVEDPHQLRRAYTIASCIIVVLAGLGWYLYATSAKDAFDLLSYIGTVATLIGLLITCCEIAHNLLVTSALHQEVRRSVNQLRAVDRAGLTAEALSSIDDLTHEIAAGKYDFALVSFQQFRKTIAHAQGWSDFKADLKVTEIELMLAKAKHSSPDEPITTRQKKNLQNNVLAVKLAVEDFNQQFRKKDVSA